jgi:hypothetical protein
MKALISGCALLAFVAATTLPLESFAQTSPGGATTVAPDTATTATPTVSTTKKSKKASKRHAKKKPSKPSANQTSSAKQHHRSLHTAARSHHSVS